MKYTEEDKKRFEQALIVEAGPFDYENTLDALAMMPGGVGTIYDMSVGHDGQTTRYAVATGDTRYPVSYNHHKRASAVVAAHLHVRCLNEYGQKPGEGVQ